MKDIRRLRLRNCLVTSWLVGGLVCVAGCSNFQARLLSHPPAPDTRVKVGWQDAVSLTSRQVANYTCPHAYVLMCEKGGAITYQCTCALR